MIEYGHASHAGLLREHNEDTYWADADAGLFLVADGMGGPGRGEVAAAIARDAVVDAARTGREFAEAIRAAGATMALSAGSAAGLPPMGTALAVLRLADGNFHTYRVGDSRVLLWHAGRLTHVDDAAPPATGTAVDDAPAPPRNRATQALGITPATELRAEPVSGALERGMQFLLCSDGLLDSLAPSAIGAVMARSELAAQECVDQLLLDALDAGGRNNVTVLLLRIT